MIDEHDYAAKGIVFGLILSAVLWVLIYINYKLVLGVYAGCFALALALRGWDAAKRRLRGLTLTSTEGGGKAVYIVR